MLALLGLGLVAWSKPASKTIDLRLSLYKQEIAKQFKDLTDAFTAANPGIVINTEITPNDGGATQAAAAPDGKLPDIIQSPAYAADFQMAKQGYVVDLSALPVIKQVDPDLLSGVTYQGKVIALPTDVGTIGILYNKAIFAKYNLQVPTTYLELQKVTQVLKKNHVIPFAGLLKENWSIGQFMELLHASMLGAKGFEGATGSAAIVKFADAMNVGKADWGKVVDLTEMFRIMDWYHSNMSKNALNNTWNEEVAEFDTGKAAMVVQGQWFINPMFNPKTSFDIGFFPFTWSNTADQNKFFSAPDSTFVLSTQSSPEKQAAAEKFLEFLATPEAIKIWTGEFKLVPAFKGADLSALPPAFGDIPASTAKVGSYIWEYSLTPDATWEDEIKNGALNYVIGKETPEQIASAIDQSWKTNYKP
jgi:raffinose/stachyose/melibiose transport system substrate-binding protein